MRRYRTRLVVGVLAVSFPLTVLFVVIVTASASSSVRSAREAVLVNAAQRMAGEVDRYAFERRRDLEQAVAAIGTAAVVPGDPAATAVLARFQAATTGFRSIELVGTDGRVLVAAPAGAAFAPGTRPWFRDAVLGTGTTSDHYDADNVHRWVAAQPVRDAGNRVVAVVAGDMVGDDLAPIVARGAPSRGRLVIVDERGRAVVASPARAPANVPSRVAAASIARGTGAIATSGVIAGVAPATTVGWGAVAEQPRRLALAPNADLRRTAAGVLAGGIVVFFVFALLFARGEEQRHPDAT